MNFKGHSVSSAKFSFVRSRLDFLSETGKVDYTYFQTKIAGIALKVVQFNSPSCIVSEMFNVE